MLHTFMQIIEEKHSSGRFILGIDGLGRAGKTTITEKLREELTRKQIPFHIFHIDDHIVGREKRYNTGHEQWFEYYHLQWEVESLANNFLKKLRSAEQITLSFYDKETDTHTVREIKLTPTCCIIIEGVFLQRKEWRECFDYVVYMDSPQQARFLREDTQTQQNIDKLQERYWKAENYYVETEKPHEQADIVLKS
ncbi:kinase [Priestia taiwanensis]|uniref:Uridine kinase n=1 Tax=Priestia taiwanensis TaxID=1347902 RepID=A0A917AJI6_9BACI|nr:kinase [Priestia taiwanensis]MBM7361662.1 uridine kinase [Priestia taiwanensis]GGE55990.1 uridine kinase [Priestia taiwanensis]